MLVPYMMWLASLGSVIGQSLLVQDLLSHALSPPALLESLPAPQHLTNNTDTHGDLGHALSTMLYHRSMMNEYLCHNYLADEILSNLNPLESRSQEPPRMPEDHGQSRLLADPGSSFYQEWLDRSSQMENMSSKPYATGDVTGYATMQTSKTGDGYNYPAPSGFSQGGGGIGGWTESTSVGDGGWDIGGDIKGWPGSGGGSKGWPDIVPEVGGDWEWEGQETGKGLALKELFNLALTAMAFLAFGVFVLNLIMTCFAKTPHITVMMTTTTTASADGRSKREVDSTNQLNELSFRVLSSVDELLNLDRQDSRRSCLQYTLCDNNKYSRALDDGNRIWLPLWSLGMSWAAMMAGGGSGLDHLRAAVLGLGDAQCTALYPHCHPNTRTHQEPT